MHANYACENKHPLKTTWCKHFLGTNALHRKRGYASEWCLTVSRATLARKLKYTLPTKLKYVQNGRQYAQALRLPLQFNNCNWDAKLPAHNQAQHAQSTAPPRHCIHKCMHVRIHDTFLHAYNPCMHACIHALHCAHACINCTHACKHTYTHAYMHACMHGCAHT